MLIPVLTFVVVASVIFGAYWVLIASPEVREQGSLRKRLKGGEATRVARTTPLLKEQEQLSSIPLLNALAENASARDLIGEPALRVIAHELVKVIKANVTVDWMHRQPIRARLRVHVKKLLRKYGYPPDLQEAAVQNVLQQAEALSVELAA